MADDLVARGKAASKWDEHAEALLRDWRNRLAAAVEAHYKRASRLRRRNLWLGVPTVILSSSVGTALFASLSHREAVSNSTKMALGAVSTLAAILAAMQTFLRFGERAEKHVVAGDWYAAIRRDVDQLLALSPDDRGRPKECFDRIRKEMAKVGQQSPEIGDRLWTVMAKKYGLDDTVLPPDVVPEARTLVQRSP
jgi:hypothetical protein